MLSNQVIADALAELARLTALAEGSPQAFRVRAYETASRAVAGATEPVAGMTPKEMTALRGVGQSTASKIAELVDTGSMGRLEELRRTFPPEFVEMTRVPGVGPKTAVLLRDQLGVASVEALREAIEREALRELPGMGAKTEENIARSIERLGMSGKDRRTPIIEAMRLALVVAGEVAGMEGVVMAEPMGSLRRFRETIGDVDVMVAATTDPDAIMKAVVELPVVTDIVSYGARKTAILGSGGLQVDVRVVEPHQWGSASMYFTGSKAHNIRLRQMAIDRGWQLNEYGLSEAKTEAVIASETEEEVYAALGLPWIPPEIREDDGEIDAALEGSLPDLVSEADLRGDLHVHSDLSGDGREPLKAMVRAAADRGYEYLGITDHAEDLTINGATREQMVSQRRSLRGMQRAVPGLRLLHGAELNIGRDGSVDYDHEFLARYDWGVASIHSLFDLDVEAQTRRVITAMENPAVNVIGHLSGRRIGKRPGIDLDIDAVLAAAVRTGCGIEINCHLDRLDASSEVLRRAAGSEVVFVISTDAHDTGELRNTVWGVRNARRGWVEKSQVANTWPARRFLRWVERKRSR